MQPPYLICFLGTSHTLSLWTSYKYGPTDDDDDDARVVVIFDHASNAAASSTTRISSEEDEGRGAEDRLSPESDDLDIHDGAR